MNTIWIVLPILTILMFDLGLTLKVKDFYMALTRPKAAASIDKVLSKAAFPALMLLVTIFFIQHYKTIFAHIGRIGLCVTALILLAAGCAALLSRVLRIDEKERRTVIIEVGMQNAAQAIALASSPFVFANEEMAIPAILYSLMMNVVLLTYVALNRTVVRI